MTSESSIVVPDRLPGSLHFAVSSTRSRELPRKWEGWWVNAHHSGCLHYRIGTRANFGRMWRIANTFLVACEVRGFSVVVASSGPGRCEGGVTIERGGFRAEITFHEKGRRGADRDTGFGVVQTIEPTGLLQIVLGHSSSYGQVLASDGEKRWRLEQRLEHALAKLERIAAERSAAIEARRERERLAAEALAIQQRAEAAALLARERRQHLIDIAECFSTAAQIRAFVAEARRTRTPSVEETGWLAWALDEANRFDPLLCPELGHPLIEDEDGTAFVSPLAAHWSSPISSRAATKRPDTQNIVRPAQTS